MVLIVGQNSSWQHTYLMPVLNIGAVNRADKIFRSAAGKGANMARCLGILGVESHLIGYAGGATGEKFVRACQEDGIPSSFVTTESETRICSSLVLPGGETTEVIEPPPSVNEEERREFRRTFETYLSRATMLAIGGTAVRGESAEAYLELVKSAKEKGIPVFLDSYRKHGKTALDGSPEVLKINSDELADLSGSDTSTVDGRMHASAGIRKRYGVRWIIITMGGDGAEAYSDGSCIAAIAPDVEVINPIGSGDAFSAGIIAAWAAGDLGPDSLQAALRKGIAMGTANCLNIKPGEVDPHAVRDLEARVSVVECQRR